MNRLHALASNGWSQFERRTEPDLSKGAQPSRPRRMAGVARVTQRGCQKRLVLTVAESWATKLGLACAELTAFTRAPRWVAVERGCRILGYALRKKL